MEEILFFSKSGLNVVGSDQSKNVVNNNKIKFAIISQK